MDFDFDIGYAYIAVAIGVIIFFYFANKEPDFNPQPIKKLPEISGDFTFDQLKKFNGTDSENVFVAIKGTIYDVSLSDFYKPGAAYSAFAGYDASINLAEMSHEAAKLNKWGQITLDQQKMEILNDWEGRFREKYRVVGKVLK